MNAAFYAEMQDVVLEQIEQFGQILDLTRMTTGTVDPVTDTETGGGPETQPIKCLVLPASKGTIEAFDNRVVSDTLIETNLRALKIVAKGLLWAPSPGNTVMFEGSVWSVLGVTPISPAGIPLLYTATVQR